MEGIIKVASVHKQSPISREHPNKAKKLVQLIYTPVGSLDKLILFRNNRVEITHCFQTVGQ